jgi:hypothetical protein
VVGSEAAAPVVLRTYGSDQISVSESYSACRQRAKKRKKKKNQQHNHHWHDLADSEARCIPPPENY